MVYSPTTLWRCFAWPRASNRTGTSLSQETAEIERLRALDTQAIARIHDQYFPELYRYARFRVGDPSIAEDIASEAFTRLLEAVHHGRGPRSSLHGWLFGTTRHLIHDHYRGRYGRPTETFSDEMAAETPDLSLHVERDELERSLRIALTHLTPEQQDVLAFRFGAGYSLEETASELRKKPNAIKALQFRALAALRRRMGEGRLVE